jgi:hypothetical protein
MFQPLSIEQRQIFKVLLTLFHPAMARRRPILAATRRP